MLPGGPPGFWSGPITAIVLSIGLRSKPCPPGPPCPEPPSCECSCPECPPPPAWVGPKCPEPVPCPPCPALELGWEEVAAIGIASFGVQAALTALWGLAVRVVGRGRASHGARWARRGRGVLEAPPSR